MKYSSNIKRPGKVRASSNGFNVCIVDGKKLVKQLGKWVKAWYCNGLMV